MRTDAPYIARERENERKVREYDVERETHIRDGLSHEKCEAGDREYDEADQKERR